MLPFFALAFLLIAPTTQPQVDEAVLTVTRVDVARAMLNFERVLHDHPPAEAKQADLNREFDRITLEFAMRHHAAAVRGLHALADSLVPAESPHSAEANLAQAVRVRIAPFVNSTDSPIPLRVKISLLYGVEIAQPTTLRLQLTLVDLSQDKHPPLIDREITIEPNGLGPSLVLEQPKDAIEGRYKIEVVAPDGYRADAGDWYISERPIEKLRRDHQNRLANMPMNIDKLVEARSAVETRNALLSVAPSENDSAQMLLNPIELSRSVAVEIAELEAGNDPFVDRPDDYWRTFTFGLVRVPARIYAPASALKSKSARLLIALHGAGGDENMFFEAYGMGEIKRQAERHGVIVVAPLTDFLMTQRNPIEMIVRALEREYKIDRSRVYLLGHSLGAMTAQRWNDGSGLSPAAVVQFGGALVFPANAKIAPTLVFGGEFDPMFPADRLESIANDARHSGLPVEFHLLPARGHTLQVGANLPAAIDWLLKFPPSSPTTQPAVTPAAGKN